MKEQNTWYKTKAENKTEKAYTNSQSGNARFRVLKAEWLFPMASKPVQNGGIVISGNKIERVMHASELLQFVESNECNIRDYGKAVILPGFINLHTHLEHTHLKYLAQECDFLDWLYKLMEATAGWKTNERSDSAREGIQESIAAGSTFIVDTSYNGASAIPLAESGLRAIIGLEIFGLDESIAETQWQEWLERYHTLLDENAVSKAKQEGRLSLTASPHAPYTVCPALWKKARDWSIKNNLPILAHLGESQAEIDWFKGSGEALKEFLIYAFSKRMPQFAQFYESLIGWKKPNISPVKHLHDYDLLSSNLIAAHAVQIDDKDIDHLKTDKVSLAHCPSSNIMLRCGKMPLMKLLEKGIKVGLGTDSAGSSNNLSLLAEANAAVKLAAKEEGAFTLSAYETIEMITIKAAKCLGLENKLGSLQNNCLADIAVFTLKPDVSITFSDNAQSVSEGLLEDSYQLEELIVDGKSIFTR